MFAPLIQLADIDTSQIHNSQNDHLIDLSHLALIHISGDDAETFLQGQFTNDITQIEPYQSQLNAYCTPKGRAIATFWLCRNAYSFWLVIPTDNAQYFVDRLKMYVMRSKVNITLPTDHLLLANIGLHTPESLTAVEEKYSLILNETIATPPAQWIIVENTVARDSVTTPVYHADLWQYWQIICAIPQVYAATREQFIPQHINFDLLEGVNFKKGCYPGQEIIARLKYLGKTKKRLFVLNIQTTATVSAGEKVIINNDSQQQAGMIVDTVRINSENIIATAVLNIDATHHPLTLVSDTAIIIDIRQSPYTLD